MKLKKTSKNSIISFFVKNWVLIFAIVYFFLPFDLIMDIVPGLGYGDDILVLLATLFIRYRQFKKEKVIEGEIVDE